MSLFGVKESGADSPHAEALYERGRSYAGSGDHKEAVRYWRKAAKRGHVLAQLALADCYADARGVPLGEEKAFYWYLRAAKQGNAEAQAKVGIRYVSGIGVVHDYAEAYKWLSQSAARGNARARYNLGVMYEYGIGDVPENPVKARELWRLAAKQGYVKARYKLGYY